MAAATADPGSARCPKCDALRMGGSECPSCGVVYAKAAAVAERRAAQAAALAREEGLAELREGHLAASSSVALDLPSQEEARLELVLRAAAIPAALLVAYLALFSGALRFVGRTFMGMWLHELGHAGMAWLAGFWAFPGPWFTSVAESRSGWVVALLAAGLLVLGVYGHQQGRRLQVALAAALLVGQLFATAIASRGTARMLITFFGDGGALVLGTAFMLTVYAPRGSKLHRGALRWGLLVIGAVAFADVLHTWLPARTDFGEIPFGRSDRAGLSDASVLVERHGWDERELIARHLRLAAGCGLALASAYLAGLVQARAELRRATSRVAGSGGPA